MARCEAEKRAWIAEKLGDSWLSPERFICVKDKTVVPGLLLIDDKPAPDSHWRGVAQKPEWSHVVFSQPFNADAVQPACRGKPRLETWGDWREVILPLLAAADRRGPSAPESSGDS